MTTTCPAISLKPGREKSLRRFHPWVFSGAIERVEGQPAAGSTVRVLSSSGEFLAFAAYSPSSQIRARAWSFEVSQAIDETFIRERVARAVDMRRQLGMLDQQGACRLIFSESDGLPGLIVDSYASHLVCQFLSAGTEFWRDAIVDSLEQLLSPPAIVERSDASIRRKEGLDARRGL
ncbi:MAG: 23S rRNA (cytosine(1962)-C(5))-methyltransferase RlmI, partial [Woeseiaceae bacterium]